MTKLADQLNAQRQRLLAALERKDRAAAEITAADREIAEARGCIAALQYAVQQVEAAADKEAVTDAD